MQQKRFTHSKIKFLLGLNTRHFTIYKKDETFRALNTLIILALVGCAGPGKIKEDKELSPLTAGDSTALIRGCGNQPISGFTYCRVTEGESADQHLDFIAPPADCDQAACAFIKIYDQAGRLTWGVSIPKGETNARVYWKDLIHDPKFNIGVRGFWSWTVRLHWRDNDGINRVSLAKGDIILRVLKKGYSPLTQVNDDPNFVWTWQEGGGYEMRSTSSLRASVRKVEPK